MTLLVPGAHGTAGLRHDYLAQTQRRRLYSGLLLLIFIALMTSGFQVAQDRNAGDFLDGLPQIFDFPANILNEAIEHAADLPRHMWDVVPALVETVNIAALSTLIGTMFGGLLALASTRGMAAWPRMIGVFRRSADVLRAVPEIVVALILIFVLGAGPVPAAIAITLHSIGAMGKLFSEVNENADLKPVEGLASVGANWAQRMLLGVIPQVAPNYFSYALLRFEINIRASAILGFVGAGGIGYELKNAMTFGQGKLDEAAGIFLVLFATIVAFDQLSSVIRHRLTHGGR
jgi:phosphonate transport system permease protein